MGKLEEILKHPDELLPLFSMYMAAKRAQVLPQEPSLRFCYDMLNRVSRSFAVVIQQLPERLRDAVCVFYLVLRALDTVEDDMAISDDIKIPLLRCFHEKSHDKTWNMECGYGPYIDLMKQYPLVTTVFQGLDHEYQRVIEDICKRMGNGMADFITTEVKTVEEYNLYCHYVAGLVGVGLSQLFASSDLENKTFFKNEELSNNMGLFLQKTNIIRDYLEDINEEPAPRMFWPKEIWGQYVRRLVDLKSGRHAEDAVACLNHMILDALSHAEECLTYMSRLKNRDIFRFCAIPQVMAMGTLAVCFNNHKVFEGVVKMRRGETAKVFWNMDDFSDACGMFVYYSRIISATAQGQAGNDPHIGEILEVCDRIEGTAVQHLTTLGKAEARSLHLDSTLKIPLPARLFMVIMAAIYAAYAWQIEEVRSMMGLPNRGGRSNGIDTIHQLMAGVLLSYAVVVLVTGRRLAN
ncbi:putative Squalene synthase LSS [Nannochloris sp. 'desiccata']|nr:hypothetical protein KSW81_000392 [Chlorella desiccata (nom. nud.)]KAH7620974.1 putative Squalene synthase LSS [Chlorella desiccata (nom. nud.)]